MIKIRSFCNQLNTLEKTRKLHCNRVFPFMLFKVLNEKNIPHILDIDCIAGRLKVVNCKTKEALFVVNRKQFIGSLWIRPQEVDKDDPDENKIILSYRNHKEIKSFMFLAYHQYQTILIYEFLELFYSFEELYLNPRKLQNLGDQNNIVK